MPQAAACSTKAEQSKALPAFASFSITPLLYKLGPGQLNEMVESGGMAKDIQKELEKIRTGIDKVDNDVVRALARRRALVIRLARVKKELKVPIYDRKREQALVDRVKKWGAHHELNEEFVEVLFRLIIMNSKEVQYHEAF